MLRYFKQESPLGIQLFGLDTKKMVEAAIISQDQGVDFIDINLGCPVKKVVSRGSGAALLRDHKKLDNLLNEIKKNLKIPLTIKIRTGWSKNEINADKIISLAKNCGVNWVAIHGRTRQQQYTGKSDWNYIESLSEKNIIPIIGNGDLHDADNVYKRLQVTKCHGLMLARGPLRNPFIFLESLVPQTLRPLFYGEDYFEILNRFKDYAQDIFDNDYLTLLNLKKLCLWFSSGFNHCASFRKHLFDIKNLKDCLSYNEDYFLSLGKQKKFINHQDTFMNSGHG